MNLSVKYNKFYYKKKMRIFLVFPLICAITYSSVISVGSDNTIVKIASSQDLATESEKNLSTSSVVNTPDVFKFGVISVPKRLCTEGLNGLAYKQLSILYPKYSSYSISSCSYTVYGPSRIYTFSLLDEKNTLIKVLSSVQNN
jgi:hypothetical protein